MSQYPVVIVVVVTLVVVVCSVKKIIPSMPYADDVQPSTLDCWLDVSEPLT